MFPIFEINNALDFEQNTLAIFRYQAQHNAIYAAYLQYLNIKPKHIHQIIEIPFLPIQFFKKYPLISNTKKVALSQCFTFTSSGTTGTTTSTHYVTDILVYEKSFLKGFEYFYGSPNDYVFLALLPNYSERTGSSLIYMVDKLMQLSNQAENGYYLYNHEALYQQLSVLKKQRKKVILIGVSFALLDFIESYQLSFPELIVMETGGMKGRRKEIIREDLHQKLQKGFHVKAIHSEYGMTELLSQAYAKNIGRYQCPPWMKIQLRDTEDPLQPITEFHRTGAINIIDLANYNSISFLATDDLGRMHPDHTFEVMGRFDASDIRGCNLMI